VNNIELKSCPFCGGYKLKIDSKSKSVNYLIKGYYKHFNKVTVSVRCNKCHSRGPTTSGIICSNNEYFEELTKVCNEVIYKSDNDINNKAIIMWNSRLSEHS